MNTNLTSKGLYFITVHCTTFYHVSMGMGTGWSLVANDLPVLISKPSLPFTELYRAAQTHRLYRKAPTIAVMHTWWPTLQTFTALYSLYRAPCTTFTELDSVVNTITHPPYSRISQSFFSTRNTKYTVIMPPSLTIFCARCGHLRRHRLGWGGCHHRAGSRLGMTTVANCHWVRVAVVEGG